MMAVSKKYQPNWQIILSDIVALILSFLIILYSMRTIDEEQKNLFFSILPYSSEYADNIIAPTLQGDGSNTYNTYITRLIEKRLANQDIFQGTKFIARDAHNNFIGDIIFPPFLQKELAQNAISDKGKTVLRHIQQLIAALNNKKYIMYHGANAANMQHNVESFTMMVYITQQLQNYGFSPKIIPAFSYGTKNAIMHDAPYIITIALAHE